MKYPYGFMPPSILVALLGLSACAPSPGQSHVRWKAGVHYEVLPEPPRPLDPGGKIRVVEFFWYGCGHCYVLEPLLVQWSRRKLESVELMQIPSQGRPISRIHARLFYTLKALGRPDLHPLVFDAIHRHGNPLETEAQQCDLLERYGVTGEAFAAAYHSPAVEQALAAADEMMRRYGIDTVPTVVIDGRYKAGTMQAGGAEKLIGLMTALTERG